MHVSSLLVLGLSLCSRAAHVEGFVLAPMRPAAGAMLRQPPKGPGQLMWREREHGRRPLLCGCFPTATAEDQASHACTPPSVLLGRVHRVLEILGGSVGPALRQRASEVAPAAPEWIAREGWGRYLLDLEDSILFRAEAEGLRSVLRDDPAAPDSLRALARSLDEIEGHLLWPPSDSARNEVQTEALLFEKCVEAGRLWDRRCQQLERYYEEIRGELPSEWDSSPHLHRKATQPPPKGTLLRDWVDEQRKLFAQGRLDSARVERLLSTGIQLVRRNQRRRDADAVFPPAFTFTSAPSPSSMKETKARQLSALAGAAQQHFDACRRVVDVGCGRGHLTRWLSQKLCVRALGLDRDESLVLTAKRLSKTVGQLPARAHSSRSSSREMTAAARAAAAAAAAAVEDADEGDDEPQQVPAESCTTDFEQCDARAPGSLSRVLRSGDLVVALHPCGPLGESVVQGVVDASREGVDVKMLLVSCCLAGRGGADVSDPRPPASLTGQRLHLQLPRTALKKANLGVFPNGNEMRWEEREQEGGREEADGGRERMHRRREARLAMRLLLEARGITVAAGREMDGLPKRSNSGTSVEGLLGISRGSGGRAEGAKRESSEEGRAAQAVMALANEALATRGLALLSEGEGAAVARAAAEAMPALRRLELMDVLVGDAVELSVNLDRACVLEEAGLYVSVGRLFPRSVSPRNLAILASTTPLRTQTSPTDVRPRINVPP